MVSSGTGLWRSTLRTRHKLTRHSRSLAGLEMTMRIFLTSLVMIVTSSLSERSYAWSEKDKRRTDYRGGLIQLAKLTWLHRWSLDPAYTLLWLIILSLLLLSGSIAR